MMLSMTYDITKSTHERSELQQKAIDAYITHTQSHHAHLKMVDSLMDIDTSTVFCFWGARKNIAFGGGAVQKNQRKKEGGSSVVLIQKS